MKIALVHYHLRTGGVSQVIRNQSAALTALGHEHLILSAGPAPPDLPHREIPRLDYLAQLPDEAPNLHQILLKQCQSQFGGPPDVWHIHNHSLGKNALFPQLIKDIAESRCPLILQPHDFAEDNRPANYHLLEGRDIHPIAPQIHYAFINSRDRGLLKAAGLPEENSHLLPNAVVPPVIGDSHQKKENLVLYPVRGIRRKNLGETVLLASLAPAGTRFAISLAPENPAWQAQHDHWENFANHNQIPIEFAVTHRVAPYKETASDFQSWLQYSTHLVTTSIAEGFGLTFLEPAVLNKPLIGRDLPEITKDFRTQGIKPGRLYLRIPIPLSAIDEIALRQQFECQLGNAYRLYGQDLREEDLETGWQKLTRNNEVDFGDLPETFQEQLILESLQNDSNIFDELKLWLAQTLAETQPASQPSSLARYTLAQSQKDLGQLYQQAYGSSRRSPGWLEKKEVLTQFLSPSRFHFLRS